MTISPIKTLLIVDDSRVARIQIRKLILSNQPDWVIIEASNGKEAIEMAGANTPDYITMDYNMPDMDGIAAAQQILLNTPKAIIVLCTANIQSNTKSLADSLGIGFLCKPFTNDTILQALAFFNSRSGS